MVYHKGLLWVHFLFLMYINDLTQVSDLKITLFADDAVLTYTDKNLVTLQNRINDELQKIKIVCK